MKKLALNDQVYGRLTLKFEVPKKGKHRYYLCLCECGKRVMASVSNIRSGNTVSCGCYKKDMISKAVRKHGKSGGKCREYNIWSGMKTRCNNPDRKDYKYYGGRGIKVCPEWSESFGVFFKDMGPCPMGLTLDRKETNGDYSKENCHWVTRAEQTRNRRATG